MKIGRYIIGLVSGLTFGMLFAPKSGKKLRKEVLKKTADSHVEGLRALGEAFRDAGEDALDELRSIGEHEQVGALLELSQEKMKSFLDVAEERGYDVAVHVQEKLEELAKLAKSKAGRARKKVVEVEDEIIQDVAFAKKRVRKATATTKRVVKKAKNTVKKAKRTVKRAATKARRTVKTSGQGKEGR
jgi:gas vesicle protein